jgi:hypothetical protein
MDMQCSGSDACCRSSDLQLHGNNADNHSRRRHHGWRCDSIFGRHWLLGADHGKQFCYEPGHHHGITAAFILKGTLGKARLDPQGGLALYILVDVADWQNEDRRSLRSARSLLHKTGQNEPNMKNS